MWKNLYRYVTNVGRSLSYRLTMYIPIKVVSHQALKQMKMVGNFLKHTTQQYPLNPATTAADIRPVSRYNGNIINPHCGKKTQPATHSQRCSGFRTHLGVGIYTRSEELVESDLSR